MVNLKEIDEMDKEEQVLYLNLVQEKENSFVLIGIDKNRTEHRLIRLTEEGIERFTLVNPKFEFPLDVNGRIELYED